MSRAQKDVRRGEGGKKSTMKPTSYKHGGKVSKPVKSSRKS